MSEKRKILLQLDPDPQPSVFDRVVAIDAGVEELFSYGNVTPEQVQGLVHGAIFTRGPKDLHRTAIFIGGSKVEAGEALLKAALDAMLPQFGLRVSVLLDANGANTTAAAAVRVAAKQLNLAGKTALVLGGTGPVGQRVGLLLAQQGAIVRLASRQQDRASQACAAIAAKLPGAILQPVAGDLQRMTTGVQLIVAAGAAGVVLLPRDARPAGLEMLIDLNAVPPLGIEGVEATDKDTQRDGIVCYGALGVGDTKMKLHRRAIAALFERNDAVLDAREVYALGESL
ncbi:MAG: NAD(P)-dependent methylenetetrahydromethanopterin dehydrogenase [Gemmataceae bacterium]